MKKIILSGLFVFLIGFPFQKTYGMSTIKNGTIATTKLVGKAIAAPVTYSYNALVNVKDSAQALYNGDLETATKKIMHAALNTGVSAASLYAMIYGLSKGSNFLANNKTVQEFLKQFVPHPIPPRYPYPYPDPYPWPHPSWPYPNCPKVIKILLWILTRPTIIIN